MLISFATFLSFLLFLILRRDDRVSCGVYGIVQHACTFLARMWLGILHYVSLFLFHILCAITHNCLALCLLFFCFVKIL